MQPAQPTPHPPHHPPAPGSRVLIRDEEWLVRHADQCAAGGYQVNCIGVSETVRNREAVFLSALDRIEIIDPRKTRLLLCEFARLAEPLRTPGVAQMALRP